MKLLQSKLLQSHQKMLLHAFSDESCGNLAFHVNDNKERVIANHKNLASLLGYNLDSLVHMQQIHSNIVHTIDEDDNFKNPPICDALITNKKKTPLMVMVADCSPILFYDPNKDVIAVAHAGRAGAFKNIVQSVINSFVDNYKSNVKDILVVIGPNIAECCYEVGSEIYKEAQELGLEYAIKFHKQKFYLNISKIIYKQLLDAGLHEENIEISNQCTKCLYPKYYSYRANKNTGRFAGVISLI